MTWRRFVRLIGFCVIVYVFGWTAYIVHHLVTHDFISREQADEKLAQVCLESTKIYLQGRAEITEFVGVTFRNDPLGNGRQVSLSMIESNTDYDKEQKYSCIFQDSLPWFGYRHIALPYGFDMAGHEFIATDMEGANVTPNVKMAIQHASVMLSGKDPSAE